ncbi:unnamed protein product, partial [Didymodactylos carnosus]
QIEHILSYEKNLQFPTLATTSNDKIRDIYDGYIYQEILKCQNGNRCITLLLSIDGVQIDNSKADNSIWVISLVINEIKRSERFKLKNVVLSDIWPGVGKPDNEQVGLIVKKLVQELQDLEQPHFYKMKNLNGQVEQLNIFLIGCCADKPATAIIQNVSDPKGKYGCFKCILKGKTELTGANETHRIRTFAIMKDDVRPMPRNNQLYDDIMAIYAERLREKVEKSNKNSKPPSLSNIRKPQKRLTKEEKIDQTKGFLGTCHLRQLTYFDMGSSFLYDTLHNAYHGLMVRKSITLSVPACHQFSFHLKKRLLNLWLSSTYNSEPWSCYHELNNIKQRLQSFRYPSSTARTPRSIDQYSKFKGNESRLILLFGFVGFNGYLSDAHYKHHLLLVLALHKAENRLVTQSDISQICTLMEHYHRLFPELYNVRQNVQTVHSNYHIDESVKWAGQ